MRRAIITVKGKVQKVRYRSKVKAIAGGLGIVGEVENLEDGSVRIYAESEEEVLNEFITKLKLRNHLIDVTDVLVRFEDATGEFRAFKKVISGTMYEVAERVDEVVDILEKLTGAVIHGNDKRGHRCNDKYIVLFKFKSGTSRNVRIEREIRAAQQGCS